MYNEFVNRRAAGRVLAAFLAKYANRNDLIVLALTHGGVPVAFELAKALRCPMDVLAIRKVRVPTRSEAAMGAVAYGGSVVRNDDILREFGISDKQFQEAADAALGDVEAREKLYRAGALPLDLHGCTIILVDDGLATGTSMRAAIESVRKQSPARIVVAVPVAPVETCREICDQVDEIVVCDTPDPFLSVAPHYRDFTPVTDEDVLRFQRESAQWLGQSPAETEQTSLIPVI